MPDLQTKIDFIKGAGPKKAELLNLELNIFTYDDLISHYPFRHEDRSRFYKIADIDESFENAQFKGKILNKNIVEGKGPKRLSATFSDGSGAMDLVWFQGVTWLDKSLKPGAEYVVYGKPALFGNKYSISHPELELLSMENGQGVGLKPVYHTTEKMKSRFLDSKNLGALIQTAMEAVRDSIQETLTPEILQKFDFVGRKEALKGIHFPADFKELQRAKARLKFEELFFIQLKMLMLQKNRQAAFAGERFPKTALLTGFYNDKLPFPLTNAQKRVIKEIFKDLVSGKQMNRLLQGDVGSGKTIVAFICMLIAIDNGAQCCLMAPTEILAEQHLAGLQGFADLLGIQIGLLTGSTKKKARTEIHAKLLDGSLNIIVGTHALLEDVVEFQNLGLCVIDEQHRFGVEQRAKLWKKNSRANPHILVMTATPIPRTLAMTLYGDLDVSIIDEMPAGRKPIITTHRYDSNRLAVFGFVREQIKQGRQVYIVYPLIEESETMDFKNLMDGAESIARAFPEFHVSIVHGKMKPADKNYEMQRFVKKETQIMIATTVIEVGVNVPNASVMIIENAERFGLAQLHQLRGRVGRGADQSYCILMTGFKLSKEGKLRLETMVRTTDGFEIADVDLKLRGPGDLSGKQQSGILDLKLADLAKDGQIVLEARETARAILDRDPLLAEGENVLLKKALDDKNRHDTMWSRIS